MPDTARKRKTKRANPATSFSLTQEELLFLLRLLELPDLPGVGEKPWGDVELPEAEQRFAQAGLSLKLRGLVKMGVGGQPTVDPMLHDMLRISTYPEQMTSLALSRAGEPAHPVYYYRSEGKAVRQMLPAPRRHLFEDALGTDMGYSELKDLFQGHEFRENSAILEIPLNDFNRARGTARASAPEAGLILREGGMESDPSERLATIMARPDLEVVAQWVYQLSPNVQQAIVHILASGRECWLAEHATRSGTNVARVMQLDHVALARLLAGAYQGFERLQPAQA